jgi:hypothetical protein
MRFEIDDTPPRGNPAPGSAFDGESRSDGLNSRSRATSAE